MPNQNSYLMPKENIAKVEEVREIENKKLYLIKRDDVIDECNYLVDKDGLIKRFNPGGDPEGIGCYNESSVNNTFNGLSSLNNLSSLTFSDPYTDYTDQNLMDPGYCIKHCADYRFQYAALIKKDKCKCGNVTLQPYIPIDNSFCNYNCVFPISSTANANYSCGGDRAYTVYKAEYEFKPRITIEEKVDITNSLQSSNVYIDEAHYVGCIPDSQHCNKRALQKLNAPDGAMTVNKCLGLCSNFRYAGLEAGNQCFCGNSINISNLAIEHCSTSCPGNSSQICGGSWALSIYEISSHGLSQGQIAGITVGSVVGAVVVSGVTYYVWKHREPICEFFHNLVNKLTKKDQTIIQETGGTPNDLIELENTGGVNNN